MNKILFPTILSIAILACACSPKPAEEKPQGVLTDTQKQTLEKAKKTQEVLDKANQEQIKATEEATGEK